MKQDKISNFSSFGDVIVSKLSWEKVMTIYGESIRNKLETFKPARNNNYVICKVFFL